MGYRLARAVVTLWSDLPGREYKLLNAMALAAHDDTARCWISAENMAAAIGHHGAASHASSGQSAVRTVLASLERRGALVRISKAHEGRTGEWLLDLARDDSPALVDNSGQEDASGATQRLRSGATQRLPEGQRRGCQRGNAEVAPDRKHNHHTNMRDTYSPNSTTHQAGADVVDGAKVIELRRARA